MRGSGGLLITILLLFTASAAEAGPWAQKKGEGQIIVKAERMTADEGYDPDGETLPLPAERRDDALSLFAEYGLTNRLTIQLKAEWQSGEDFFVEYEGAGPVEIGVTWQVWRDDAHAVSLYAGYARAGEGRNAGYAQPGVGEDDFELRLSAGRSVQVTSKRRFAPDSAFLDAQVARRMRDGLPDETRLDLTSGARYGRWMVLNQIYAGEADGGAQWASTETSLVRDFGRWSLQAGWRQTLAGRETPISSGPVIGVWRRF